MTSRHLLMMLATAAALAAQDCSPARAADLDSYFGGNEDIPEQKVLFGSGWYIRGDLGATSVPQVSTSSQAVPTVNTNSLFVDNAPGIDLTSSHRVGYTASLGAGYAFTHWFRTDAIFDFHQPQQSTLQGSPFHCQSGYGLIPSSTDASGATVAARSYPTYGTCTGNYRASLTSFDALVNGYVDLGTWHSITPYIGAGIGLSFGHYQTSSTYQQADTSSYNIHVTEPVSNTTYHLFFDRSSSGEYYNFAFAAMAGVSIDVFDHTKLDLGYRYLNLGNILGSNLSTQEVRAGLRYMVDN